MKNIVFGNVTPCGFCKNRRFGRTYFLHHQGDKIHSIPVFLRSVLQLVHTADIPSSPILVTLMMEAILSPKRRLS
jgi:hypothetical protein